MKSFLTLQKVVGKLTAGIPKAKGLHFALGTFARAYVCVCVCVCVCVPVWVHRSTA